jgi:hypothetical protein
VAISKTKPASDIEALYKLGHRDFGENKVQELAAKKDVLPADIRWHMVGHLQRNKVKYIAGFIDLIHSVDSLKLLKAIHKEGKKNERVIHCLLQVHIASEDTKFGFSEEELTGMLESDEYKELDFVNVRGLMGMATFTSDMDKVKKEFHYLSTLFSKLKRTYFDKDPGFSELSMGMTNDYPLAIEEGATMIRIGSLIFGERDYS